jgi:predicted enzyme related to lactoylglutathione lyase
MNGQIGWIELYSEDAAGSATFYEQAFGWHIQRDPSMGDYVMFTDAGGLGGGFTKSAPKLEGGVYILTDSIESSFAAVEAAGGRKVQDRTPISGDVGSWATFSDPSGNVMGLFERTGGQAPAT